MANERAELPSGFSWQKIPQIGAAFPIPQGWHYRFEEAPGTLAFFITRELISSTSVPSTKEELEAEVAEGRGFRTGLSVNIIEQVSRRSPGLTAVSLAKAAVTQNSLLIPEGSLDIIKDGGPFVTHRGYFRSGSKLLVSQGMPPIKYYIDSTANRRTDRTYWMTFEAREEEWDTHKQTAKVILNNRILNPRF